MEITTNPFQRLAVSFGKIKKDFWKIVLYAILYFLPLLLLSVLFQLILQSVSLAYFGNMTLVLFWFVGILLFILLLTIYSLGYILFFTKMIKNSFDNEKIIFKEILSYSIKNLWKITKMYWYGFWYFIKIPFLIIVVGGIFSIIGGVLSTGIIAVIGTIISLIGSMLLIVFFLVRGIRISCISLNAIEKNDFSKKEVFSSIDLITLRWWKTFGNFVIAYVLIPLPSTLILWCLEIFLYGTTLYFILTFILWFFSVFLYIFSRVYYFQYYKELASSHDTSEKHVK